MTCISTSIIWHSFSSPIPTYICTHICLKKNDKLRRVFRQFIEKKGRVHLLKRCVNIICLFFYYFSLWLLGWTPVSPKVECRWDPRVVFLLPSESKWRQNTYKIHSSLACFKQRAQPFPLKSFFIKASVFASLKWKQKWSARRRRNISDSPFKVGRRLWLHCGNFKFV